MRIKHIGHALVHTPDNHTLHLKNVLHVPHATKNLISAARSSYPEGDDGVQNPPELAGGGEERQEGGEGKVPHHPAGAPLPATAAAAAKKWASPGTSHGKAPPSLHSPSQGPDFPQELTPDQRFRRGEGPIRESWRRPPGSREK